MFVSTISRAAALGITAALALAGCTSAEQPAPEPNSVESLIAHQWSLAAATLGGELDLIDDATASTDATLAFSADGTLSGSTGCREFAGAWQRAASPDPQYVGVETSEITVSEATCATTGEGGITRARTDARILGALDELSSMTVSADGRLSISGAATSSGDADGPVQLLYLSEDQDTFGWSETDWGVDDGGLELDDNTLRSGPIQGGWFLTSGTVADGTISPSQTGGTGDGLPRRTVWSFDGTTFSSGSGCSTIAGTIEGEFGGKVTLEVTSIGDCALDSDDSLTVNYDLESDQVIQALLATVSAQADEEKLVLRSDSGELVFVAPVMLA